MIIEKAWYVVTFLIIQGKGDHADVSNPRWVLGRHG